MMGFYYLYEIGCSFAYCLVSALAFIVLSFCYRSIWGQIFLMPLRNSFHIGSFSLNSLQELLHGEIRFISFFLLGWVWFLFLGYSFILLRGVLFVYQQVRFYLWVSLNISLGIFVGFFLLQGFQKLVKRCFYLYSGEYGLPSLFVLDVNFLELVALEIGFMRSVFLILLGLINIPAVVGFFYGFQFIQKHLFYCRCILLVFIFLVIGLYFPPDLLLHLALIASFVVLFEGLVLCSLIVNEFAVNNTGREGRGGMA